MNMHHDVPRMGVSVEALPALGIVPMDIGCVAGAGLHKPETHLRLVHDGNALKGCFTIGDCYVRSVHQGFQSPVYKDSCVELFLQPKPGGGYFNFEFNAGGAMLVYWIEDPLREGDGFRKYQPLSLEACAQVTVRSSLPARVVPEIQEPLQWTLSFVIPVVVLEHYAGPIGDLSGQRWRANAYKCGDETSHPHWLSWAPLDTLDFHRPQCFGELVFA